MELFRPQAVTLVDLLPEHVMTQIVSAGKTRRYRDGVLIQQRRDTRRGISILLSGQIIAGNVGLDGSFVVSSVLQPGDFFGEFTLFAGLPRTHDLSASGAVTLVHLAEAPFFQLFDQEPAIGKALLTITLRRMHDLLEFLDGQRRLSLPVRVAKLLVSFASKEDGLELVRCKQEELAYMLGVTRLSVSKALRSLVEEGLLSLGYRMIEIIDVPGLKLWIAERSLVVPVSASVLGR